MPPHAAGVALLSSRLVRRLLPLLILVIGAVALYVDFMPGSNGLGSGTRFVVLSNVDAGFNQQLDTKLGLDLSGGFSVTYQAQPITQGGKTSYPDSNAMDTIRGIIENRVNSTGTLEAIVETQGTDQVVVQVPNAANPDEIKALVGQQGTLTFIPLDRTTYGFIDTTTGAATPGTQSIPAPGADVTSMEDTALFGGDQVDGGQSTSFYDTSATPNQWAVRLVLKDAAKAKFSTWSSANVGSYFMIVLSDHVVETPYIKNAITDGTAVISGSFDATSSKKLATILKYGALPFPLHELTESYIPATLGKTFLDQTLLAGLIGIGLVMAFMLIYYRLPGLIACLALFYYSIVVLAIFRIIPVTLTLAGIAAFVLSVGMAVDANILIFERTKEELRTGKTLASALEAGFNRAWNSIFDSNVSSLITASILYFLGSPTIKGFALVLMIGVATSLFSAITVSRTLLRVVVKQGFANKAWMYGVTDEEFQARATPGRYRREARGRV
jgi:preprotein translocase subunit SecD